MKNIISWIEANKSWVFSGIGITILGILFKSKDKLFAIVKKIYKRIKFHFNNNHKNNYKTVPIKDNSTFISENPYDGCTIPCDSVFEKEWTIKNSGNEIWENRYIKCVEYPGKSFYPEKNMVKIKKVYPGETVTLKVRYFAKAEGDYVSRWKMCDKDENYFFPDKRIGLGVNIHVRNKD